MATMTMMTLALVACGSENDSQSGTRAAAGESAFDAFVEYRGRRYEMVVPGDCGAKPDGTYLTWAVTLDSKGALIPDAPHLYAKRAPNWSVIDFYSPDEDRIVRIYREGRDRFSFDDDVLQFEGELGAGLTEKAMVQIRCPEQQPQGAGTERQP